MSVSCPPDCDRLRVVFAGTPEFAVPTLDRLLGSAHQVIAVLTQPDRPAGRGRKLQPSPIKMRAKSYAVPVLQPATLRTTDAQNTLESLAPDVIVVVAYGLLLPLDVLQLPPLGCLNVHGSLLPRWRGAAPLQRAILAGDAETGISIMTMAEGLDTGPILSQHAVPITARTNAAELHNRLAELGAEALLADMPKWCRGEIAAQPQDDRRATYAAKLTKGEALIDWRASTSAIDRQVRAFNPWPIAATEVGGGKLRIWRAAPGAMHCTEPPGTIIRCDRTGIEVATGDGTLQLLELQLPGRKPMLVKEFVNGRDLTGQRFSPAGSGV